MAGVNPEGGNAERASEAAPADGIAGLLQLSGTPNGMAPPLRGNARLQPGWALEPSPVKDSGAPGGPQGGPQDVPALIPADLAGNSDAAGGAGPALTTLPAGAGESEEAGAEPLSLTPPAVDPAIDIPMPEAAEPAALAPALATAGAPSAEKQPADSPVPTPEPAASAKAPPSQPVDSRGGPLLASRGLPLPASLPDAEALPDPQPPKAADPTAQAETAGAGGKPAARQEASGLPIPNAAVPAHRTSGETRAPLGKRPEASVSDRPRPQPQQIALPVGEPMADRPLPAAAAANFGAWPDAQNASAGGHAPDIAITHVGTPTAAAAPESISPKLPPAVKIEGVALEIATQASEGRQRFEIRLDPPELGRIDVRLDFTRDGQVTARLVVDRAETLDLLRRDSSNLERTLESAGLRTDDSGLQFSLRNQSNGHAQTDREQSRLDLIIVPDEDLAVREAVQRAYNVLRGLGRGVDIRI